MVVVAADASIHQQNADASRDIMQSLFKDLGKQAMALEAILRVVCGKVDRMETWITTISYGMSELDLKLRNIAHNIDGTSAVDEDAGGSQPWTVPPPEDDLAVATVSKKFGKNSKQVRVTGMAAAIIDQLAAETKDGSEKTKKKKKPPTTPTADTPKRAAKKKKSPGSAQPINASSAVEQQPAVASIELNRLNSADSSAESDTKHDEKVPTRPEAGVKPATSSCDDTIVAQAVLPSEPAIGMMEDKQLQAKHGDHQLEPTDAESAQSTSALQPQASADDIPLLHSDQAPPQSLLPKMQDDRESSSGSSSESTPNHSPRDSEHHETEDAREVHSQYDQSQASTSRSATSTPRSPTSTHGISGEDILGEASLSGFEASVHHEELTDSPKSPEGGTATPEQRALECARPPSFIVPTLPQSVALESQASISSPQPSYISSQAATETSGPNSTPPSTSILVELAPCTASTTDANGQTISNESAPRRRSSLLQRVLAMNEAAERQAQQAPSVSESQVERRPPSAAKSRQSNAIVVEAEKEQPERPDLLPAAQNTACSEVIDNESENDAFKEDSDSRRSEEGGSSSDNGGSDNDDNLDDDSSNSSDDSTGSVSEETQPMNEHSSSAATMAAFRGGKRASVATGSTISRTMTALKKLKKANMLTREEEEELKQRAQDKWFKLKGHVKEKQKKDVANILLKRKKNVFTVSSRLELLEEKSRELFASIKQIGNELKLKTDLTAHESLRRQAADMQRSLLGLDARLGKMVSQLTPEKVAELGKQLENLRSSISEEIVSLHQIASSNYAQLDAQIVKQHDQLHVIEEIIPQKLAAQAEAFEQNLQSLPDFGSAIDSIRRALRRKADLKMLKELEARLLGHTVEDEDCLVRCLSCHKEVISLQQIDKDGDEDETGNGNANQLRKVYPGPSSAKIYRSNVPFSAEPSGLNSDSVANTDGTLIPVEAKSTAATAAGRRIEIGLPKASPISRLSVVASATPPSPDRPISAPAAAVKKKSSSTVKAGINAVF